MGFINDVRKQRDGNKNVTKNIGVNPLDEYSMYNFNDVINDIYIIDDLREKGNIKGAEIAYKKFVKHGVDFAVGDPDMDNFLSYLIEQSELNGDILNTKKTKELTDNEKLVSAVIIQEGRDSGGYQVGLSFNTLCKFLNLSHARQTTLTDSEYSQLSGYNRVSDSEMYKSMTRRLVSQYPIPKVKHIEDIYTTNDLSALYDSYGKDKFFKDNYKIKNVYEIANNKQSANAHKQGSESMILNSGTSNTSLIKILNGGFKLPSELARDAGVQISGQMYGDAVYFARPNQISKNTAYLDRVNPGSKFIMVAEVFYDKKIDADRNGGRFKYDGHTLVHAHNVGRYDRDEYMVHPSQIQLKYVLEVDDGKFVKPKRKAKTNTDTVDVNVSLTLNDLDTAQQI